jgi:hypothetical protein
MSDHHINRRDRERAVKPATLDGREQQAQKSVPQRLAEAAPARSDTRCTPPTQTIRAAPWRAREASGTVNHVHIQTKLACVANQ